MFSNGANQSVGQRICTQRGYQQDAALRDVAHTGAQQANKVTARTRQALPCCSHWGSSYPYQNDRQLLLQGGQGPQETVERHSQQRCLFSQR